jgi:hypothetical protein
MIRTCQGKAKDSVPSETAGLCPNSFALEVAIGIYKTLFCSRRFGGGSYRLKNGEMILWQRNYGILQ